MSLLLMSVLVFGGVLAWVVDLEANPDSSRSIVSAPRRSEPETQPPRTSKAKQTPPMEAPKQPPPTEPPKPPSPPKEQKKPEHDDPKLRALLQQLKDDNSKAIEALEKLEPALQRQAIPAMIDAAERQDMGDFREKASQELVSIGAPRPEDCTCLIKALRNPYIGMQRYVVVALRDLGEQAKAAPDVWVEALKHGNAEIQSEAFALLKNLGSTVRAPVIQRLLNPNAAKGEELSLGVLKKLLDEAAPLSAAEMDEMAAALRDSKRPSEVRRFALANLGEGGHVARAIPALVKVLGEKGDDELVRMSIEKLSRIGGKRPEVLTALRSLAKSTGKEELRLESLRALEQLDSSAFTIEEILKWRTAEKSSAIQQELSKVLESRLKC